MDNAIEYIQNVQQENPLKNIENTHPNFPNLLKSETFLKSQIKKFRDFLRHEFASKMSEKEFCILDFDQLHEIILKHKAEPKNNNSLINSGDNVIKDAINDAGDVFVVATENRSLESNSDHTYSLIVQQEAEIEIAGCDQGEPEIVILDQGNSTGEDTNYVEVRRNNYLQGVGNLNDISFIFQF